MKKDLSKALEESVDCKRIIFPLILLYTDPKIDLVKRNLILSLDT